MSGAVARVAIRDREHDVLEQVERRAIRPAQSSRTSIVGRAARARGIPGRPHGTGGAARVRRLRVGPGRRPVEPALEERRGESRRHRTTRRLLQGLDEGAEGQRRSSEHRPHMYAAELRALAISFSSRDLPTPASPSTSTSRGRPASTSARHRCRRSSSRLSDEGCRADRRPGRPPRVPGRRVRSALRRRRRSAWLLLRRANHSQQLG
jgi:hypothetical protein